MPDPNPNSAQVVTVDLKTDTGISPVSYDICIGSGLIELIAEYIEPLLSRRFVAIVADENVEKLYGDGLRASLEKSGIASTWCVVPASEGSKSFTQLERICQTFLSNRIERSDLMLGLGGGVVGDLASFAASILLRGIRYVAIPTTLLAQVDSSVGGKTAINLSGNKDDAASGKNLIGTFYNPSKVIADTNLLASLDDRQFRSGYAEVVKYGVLGDATFFAWLQANHTKIMRRENLELSEVVVRCCTIKAEIVAEDLLEHGKRALLNLGHTFGHAFEALAGFGEGLTHGEAVAAGMVEATALSESLGICSPEVPKLVSSHLHDSGLPAAMNDVTDRLSAANLTDATATVDAILDCMARDKKVKSGKIGLVLVRRIGESFVSRDVDISTLRDFLLKRLSQTS